MAVEKDVVLPQLSVLLLAPYGIDSLREVLAVLSKQDRACELELVLVLPSQELELQEPILQEFHSYQTLLFEGETTGPVRAKAVALARAPVVAMGEDHALPEPGWAAALIEAHQQGWAAVGYQVLNGNPESEVSWTLFFLYNGAYTGWTRGREMEDLGWHQTSYKRDVLLELGNRLGFYLDFEGLLFAELRKRGHRLFLEAEAKVRHLQFAGFRELCSSCFHCARRFAAGRAKEWGKARRLLRAMVVVLLPLKSFARIFRHAARAGELDRIPTMIPSLVVGLGAEALGEMWGYITGPGNSDRVKFDGEFERVELAK